MKRIALLLGLFMGATSALAAYNPNNPNGQALMAASQPVVIASNQSALPVTGTFWQATQPVSGTFWQVTQPVSGPLTDVQMRAAAVPVSLASVPTHGVTGVFWQATQPVSGAFFQATQPISIAATVAVSGPLTDTQLRLSAVPVSLASTTVTGSVAVTGAFFQATQPVSLASTTITGTVAVTGALTDTQLRASAVPVSLASVPTHPVTQSGTWAIGGNSLVSTVNSSAVNLAAAAVFTGTSEDVTEYSTIAVTAFSSHASATDGLSMQQSSDGANWDVADVYTVPAASGKIFSIAVSARFYRLVYTNGATLTTALRIQTLYSKNAKKGSSVRPSDARGNDNDFEETSAFAHGYNGTSWDRLRSTTANGLAVDVTRLPALVAGSAIAGKFGIDQTTPGTTNAVQFTNTTLAVTGAFFQATQPVSLTSTTITGTVAVTPPTLTKGTQGATGVSTQDLKDAGRNQVMCYTNIAVLTAAADTLQSLNCTKSNATVAATTTPAVVTAAKTFRVTRVSATYISVAASGYAIVKMRFNNAGVVAIGSPIAVALAVGNSAPTTANAADSVEAIVPDGWEFAAGTGVGISVQGIAAGLGVATGYVMVSFIGFEY